MLAGFKEFISRGSVVELAVAVVIGAAFGAVVTSLVADLLTPLIGAIVGEQDFSTLTFTINGSEFRYGNFINALFAFVTIAAAVYFFVVLPLNKLEERRKEGLDPDVKECPACTSEIPFAARRCPQCTTELSGTPG
jgi:large conductance mechanosensitive channel